MRRLSARSLAARLAEILASPETRQRAQALGVRVHSATPEAAACDQLERLAAAQDGRRVSHALPELPCGGSGLQAAGAPPRDIRLR
jgi:hypothetical protein